MKKTAFFEKNWKDCADMIKIAFSEHNIWLKQIT